MNLSTLLDALQDARVYPHPARDITVVHTHASAVVLAGEHVYKLKKPVDFGFLDYSTLEKRRAMCESEVELNRRLAPGVYLGVVPIALENGRVVLGGIAAYSRTRDPAPSVTAASAVPAQTQANAIRAIVFHRLHIVWQFDIGHQINAHIIQRQRISLLQALEFAAFQFDLGLAQSVLFQHPFIGVDDDDATETVNDQQLAIANDFARTTQTHHSRDGHAPRQNGRVRCRTAYVSHERGETVLLEADQIRRRQIVRHDDLFFFLHAFGGLTRFADLAGTPHQFFNDALDHLHHIGLALT